jgi:hypothetical protein
MLKFTLGLACSAMLAAGAAYAQQGNPTTMESSVAGDPVLRGQSTDAISARSGPGNPDLPPNSAWHWATGVSSNEVFDAHDANGDGTLDKDEFGRALHFNPVFDCTDASSTFDDPRCARWKAVSGR